MSRTRPGVPSRLGASGPCLQLQFRIPRASHGYRAAVTELTPTATALPKVDPTYAWTVAALPLATLILVFVVPSAIDWAWVPVLAVTLLLCSLDRRRIEEVMGVELPPADVLLVPLYLVDRTRKIRSTPAIPVAWFAAFGFSLLALSTFAAPADFVGSDVEPEIATWVQQQGAHGISVDCPEAVTVRAGQTVSCTVSDTVGNSRMVDVTVQTDQYTWVWAS